MSAMKYVPLKRFLGYITFIPLALLLLYMLQQLHQIVTREESTLPQHNSSKHWPSSIKPRTAAAPKWHQKLRDYYVYTTRCRIPRVDPFTKEIQAIFKPMKSADYCANGAALIRPVYDINRRRYLLQINETALQQIGHNSDENSTVESATCCYSEILRAGTGDRADDDIELLPCTPFQHDFVVPAHVEAMLVNCTLGESNATLQQDGFYFVQDKNASARTQPPPHSAWRRRPSVLLMGVDSLSRFNLRRNMPLTTKWLSDSASSWHELEGYNKVGDNTFPNLMPLLTGYSEETVFSECPPNENGRLDECPFIWQNFSRAGYLTAYAEDSYDMTTFNYLKRGFTQPPTDYYFRPMAIAVEHHLPVEEVAGLAYCVGRRQYGEYIYDAMLEFTRRHTVEPIFGLFWANSFSHNSYNVASSMDAKMLEYFQALQRDGVLDSAIVIFVSDHGMRWGSLMDLPEAFLEERLPLCFISLPGWFRADYPEFVDGLRMNRNRLTSPYDLYMTLLHILQLGEGPLAQRARDCPTCHSLFYEAAENRTCQDAAIPEHWCTCDPAADLEADSARVAAVLQPLINEMNAYIGATKMGALCSNLSLATVTQAKVKLVAESERLPDVSIYRLSYVVLPREASFQATVKFNDTDKQLLGLNVANDVSRLNSYANDSTCVEDKELKKYCICKNAL